MYQIGVMMYVMVVVVIMVTVMLAAQVDNHRSCGSVVGGGKGISGAARAAPRTGLDQCHLTGVHFRWVYTLFRPKVQYMPSEVLVCSMLKLLGTIFFIKICLKFSSL